MWCLAHRAELSAKDCLSGTVFDSIDEMLYKNLPKKCQELEDLVSDLGRVYVLAVLSDIHGIVTERQHCTCPSVINVMYITCTCKCT